MTDNVVLCSFALYIQKREAYTATTDCRERDGRSLQSGSSNHRHGRCMSMIQLRRVLESTLTEPKHVRSPKMGHCVRIPGTENRWRWICLVLLLGQCSTPTTVGYSNTEISYSSGLVGFECTVCSNSGGNGKRKAAH